MSEIKNNLLFKDLTDEQMGFVRKKLHEKHFRSSEKIIEENSLGNSVYVLLKGQIIIEKNLIPVFEGYNTDPDDKKIIKIGDSENYFFGEMSLFDPELKRSASILADSNVVVLELSDNDFNYILKKRPDIGIIILRNIGLKLSRLIDRSNVEMSKLITAFTIALKL